MPIKELPKNLILAHAGFLTANVIWGAATPIIKYTLGYIPPATFLLLRFLICAIILLPYMFYTLHRIKVDRRDYFNLFLLGTFSQTSLIIVFVALKYTTALDAAMLSILGTVLTIYAGHYFYKEKINKLVKLGLILASIGSVIVIIEPALADLQNHTPIMHRIYGNLLTMFYNLIWVVYVVWSKMSTGENSPRLKKALSFMHIRPMYKKYSPIFITAISFYIGLLSIAPLAVIENMSGNTGSFNITHIELNGVIGLMYMALLSSLAAYMAYQWALVIGKVSDSAIYSYLGPVFTFPVAFVLLGELPTTILLIGSGVIALGVVLAEKGSTQSRA